MFVSFTVFSIHPMSANVKRFLKILYSLSANN
nr:MAG TPA: hypothetical protein [Bacteriophage sp.]